MSSEAPSDDTYHWRALSLLCLPVPILIAVQASLSETLATQLAFNYYTPRVYTVWSSMAVHYGWAHLVNNLVAYLAVTLVAYSLAAAISRERLFWRAAVGVGVAVPPIAVGVDQWLLASYWDVVTPATTAAGFSVIVGGLTGLLTVLIGIVATAWYGRYHGTLLVGTLVCSGGLLAVAQSQFVSRSIAGAAVLALAGIGGWALQSRHRWMGSRHIDVRDILLASGCVLVVVLIGSLFTYRVVAGELSGVFAHGAAFTTGFVWGLLANWIDTNLL